VGWTRVARIELVVVVGTEVVDVVAALVAGVALQAINRPVIVKPARTKDRARSI
jgi:hypothetical protein